MIDTKIPDQNPVSGSQIQPSAPIGVANKEIGRVAAPVSELITRSGVETIPNLPPEVSDANVKVPTDKPFLTPAHKEMGLVHSGPDVTVPTSPTGLVQIPQTKDVNNSSTWLNTLREKVRKLGKLLGV